jgi:hypothetical protein
VTPSEMVDSSELGGPRCGARPTDEEVMRREVTIMRQEELFATVERLMPPDLWSVATLIPLEEGSPGPFLEIKAGTWELVLKRTRNVHLVANVRRRSWAKAPKPAIGDLDIGCALDFVRTMFSELHH